MGSSNKNDPGWPDFQEFKKDDYVLLFLGVDQSSTLQAIFMFVMQKLSQSSCHLEVANMLGRLATAPRASSGDDDGVYRLVSGKPYCWLGEE